MVLYDHVHPERPLVRCVERNPHLAPQSRHLISLLHVTESERIVIESELVSAVRDIVVGGSGPVFGIPQPCCKIADSAGRNFFVACSSGSGSGSELLVGTLGLEYLESMSFGCLACGIGYVQPV